jgi:hypothetical protein
VRRQSKITDSCGVPLLSRSGSMPGVGAGASEKVASDRRRALSQRIEAVSDQEAVRAAASSRIVPGLRSYGVNDSKAACAGGRGPNLNSRFRPHAGHRSSGRAATRMAGVR